jgi:sterol desaturase/sphingolipid hydroxylase (fatty acid hydroxylase superfamily)
MERDWEILSLVVTPALEGRGYWVALLSSLLIFGIAETFHPRRRLPAVSGARWIGNCLLAFVNLALVGRMYPDIDAVIARFAPIRLVETVAALGGSAAIAVMLGIAILDLGRYMLHRLTHAVPLLWRFHAIHHSDRELDVTTSFRHHPVEYALIGAAIMALVVALGLPVASLAWYALIAVVLAPLQHANLALPGAIERVLRPFVVTGAMHALHHSVEPRQGNSNFATVLPWWDRLFGTFVDPHAKDARAVEYGVTGIDAETANSPWRLLALPLRRGAIGGPA